MFGVLSITQNCKNIESLIFDCCDKIETKAVEAMVAVPGLKVLEIRQGGTIKDSAFDNFACSSLTQLVLLRVQIADTGIQFARFFNKRQGLSKIASVCRSLKYLDLTSCTTYTSDGNDSFR